MESLQEKFEEFVKSLTNEEVREELVCAYMQMERCQKVLNGIDAEPVEMKDNGESSDLELFYQCKKMREELDALNAAVSKGE